MAELRPAGFSRDPANGSSVPGGYYWDRQRLLAGFRLAREMGVAGWPTGAKTCGAITVLAKEGTRLRRQQELMQNTLAEPGEVAKSGGRPFFRLRPVAMARAWE
jgi:hypothetical protein